MDSIKLHPEVEALPVDSIETVAIRNLMHRALAESMKHQKQLQQWLQELNPHKMKGPELTKWAHEVSSYVLPIPLRFPNVIETQKHQSLDNGEVNIPSSRR